MKASRVIELIYSNSSLSAHQLVLDSNHSHAMAGRSQRKKSVTVSESLAPVSASMASTIATLGTAVRDVNINRDINQRRRCVASNPIGRSKLK